MAPADGGAMKSAEQDVRELVILYGGGLGHLTTGVQSGNLALLDKQYTEAKRLRGRLRTALNLYRQAPRRIPVLEQSMAKLLDDCEAAVSALLHAREQADEPEARALLREVRVLLDERIGKEERLKLMAQAAENMRKREEETVTRRMAAGNAISLGASGGMRKRRAE